MELVIGGSFQGKLAYAQRKLKQRNIIVTEAEILDGGEIGAPEPARRTETPKILNRLHELVRRQIWTGTPQTVTQILDELLRENPENVIVCDEVGYGVVPVDEREERYREEVGRTLCYLAERAERMERVVGGIAMRIR